MKRNDGITLVELVLTMLIAIIVLMVTSTTFLDMIYNYQTLTDLKYSQGIAEECAEKMIGYYWNKNTISNICGASVGIYTISVTSSIWSSYFTKVSVTVTGGKIRSTSRAVTFIVRTPV